MSKSLSLDVLMLSTNVLISYQKWGEIQRHSPAQPGNVAL